MIRSSALCQILTIFHRRPLAVQCLCLKVGTKDYDDITYCWNTGSFARSAELLSPRPSLSFDCSPTQEIPLSLDGYFGIYRLIISLEYLAYASPRRN